MSAIKKLTKQIRILFARIELAMCRSTLKQCIKNRGDDYWDIAQDRSVLAAFVECLRANKKLNDLRGKA